MNYVEILSRRYNGKQWHLVGNDYDGLTWLDESTKPTKSELESFWPGIKTEIEDAQANKDAKRIAVLNKLGLTEDEAAALLS